MLKQAAFIYVVSLYAS